MEWWCEMRNERNNKKGGEGGNTIPSSLVDGNQWWKCSLSLFKNSFHWRIFLSQWWHFRRLLYLAWASQVFTQVLQTVKEHIGTTKAKDWEDWRKGRLSMCVQMETVQRDWEERKTAYNKSQQIWFLNRMWDHKRYSCWFGGFPPKLYIFKSICLELLKKTLL